MPPPTTTISVFNISSGGPLATTVTMARDMGEKHGRRPRFGLGTTQLRCTLSMACVLRSAFGRWSPCRTHLCLPDADEIDRTRLLNWGLAQRALPTCYSVTTLSFHRKPVRCAAMGAAVRYAAFVAEWLATCKYNIHCNDKFSPSDTENTLSLL